MCCSLFGYLSVHRWPLHTSLIERGPQSIVCSAYVNRIADILYDFPLSRLDETSRQLISLVLGFNQTVEKPPFTLRPGSGRTEKSRNE
jgi:hypothetical protein